MTEQEITGLLIDWQINQWEGEYDKALEIEGILLKAGLNMEDDWERILYNRGLIQ